MKIGIYDPYLDSLGGGERYVLTLAQFLSAKNKVEIFWDDLNIREAITKRLLIDTGNINFVSNIFTRDKNLLQKLILTRNYDLIFFLSDGSVPAIFSKKGILHFQVPFSHLDGKTIMNRLKLSQFQKIVCNSNFTKKFIDQTYGVNSMVIYPPVDTKNFKPGNKKNIILSVGRFSKTLHNKRQEIMIDGFKEIFSNAKNWELLLVGGALANDEVYVDELKKKSDNFPIRIFPNLSFNKLQELYGQAKIYWHAAGFGENEEVNPERMEHFGITTVEAMAAGCVPLVFNGGGQKEIIKSGENGILWESLKDLQDQTLSLISDERRWEEISLAAQNRSSDFSQEKFYENFSKVISS